MKIKIFNKKFKIKEIHFLRGIVFLYAIRGIIQLIELIEKFLIK